MPRLFRPSLRSVVEKRFISSRRPQTPPGRAALYESFVTPFFVLLAVPLSLIGVFVAFIAAKAPFDPTAYIGVILLSGIVVNNAILLVDHIGLRRRQGLGLREAVLRGTRDRVRPIVMTTATTVFGMLPLLLIGSKAAERQIWSSLALCTVGGLTTSTLLILVVIPVLYYHGDGLRAWGAEKAREARGQPLLSRDRRTS